MVAAPPDASALPQALECPAFDAEVLRALFRFVYLGEKSDDFIERITDIYDAAEFLTLDDAVSTSLAIIHTQLDEEKVGGRRRCLWLVGRGSHCA